MKIRNISTQNVTLANFAGNLDIKLAPGEVSIGFVGNKEKLNTLINKKGKLEIIVTDPNELELLSRLDPRVTQLVVYS